MTTGKNFESKEINSDGPVFEKRSKRNLNKKKGTEKRT